MPTSRREFLINTTALAAAGALQCCARMSQRADIPSEENPLRAIVTDSSGRRHQEIRSSLAPSNCDLDATITIHPARPRQSILGFGCALTDSSCYLLSRLPQPDQTQLLNHLFSPDQMNLSICRLCIGASDYSTELFSYDEGDPDPRLKRFTIDHDRKWVLPIVHQARAIRSDLFLFSSPWSPPGWMKYSQTMNGGTIRPQYLPVYADYIVHYLLAYRSAGIHINAITIQNETDADQDGQMPACSWSEEVEARYISQHLGPAIHKAQLGTQIWLLDHNYDLVGRVLDQLSKKGVRKYIKAIAWHGYAGKPEQMRQIPASYPDMEMHWTEGGSSFDAKDYLTDWCNWSANFSEILRNGPRSIITWNLALDEKGKPNIGPFHCGGLLCVNSQTQAITYSGTYWALMHYAKAFPRGSTIVDSMADIHDISHVAAKTPDGAFTVILTNRGKTKNIRIACANQARSITLSRDSITTFKLSAGM